MLVCVIGRSLSEVLQRAGASAVSRGESEECFSRVWLPSFKTHQEISTDLFCGSGSLLGRPRPGLRKDTLQGSGTEGTVWKPASPQPSWPHVSLGDRADDQVKDVPPYRDRLFCCLFHISSLV